MKKIFILMILYSFTLFGSDVDYMWDKVNKINKGIKQNKIKIKESKKEEIIIRRKLNKIEKKYKKIEKEYNDVVKKYTATSRNVEYGEKSLKVIEARILNSSELFRKKELLWYKYGDKKYLEYLLSGITIYETVDIRENLKIILKRDEKIIEKVNSIKQEAQEKKVKIEKEKEELNVLRKDLRVKKKELASTKREKDRLVRRLKTDQRKIRKKLTRLQVEKTKTEKMIESIIRERARKIANVKLKTALRKIGFMMYPVKGRLIVAYNQEKIDNVKSTAIEVRSKLGARVRAAAKGEIIYVGKFPNLGTVVMLDHGYNMVSVYGNLIHSYAKVGMKLNKSDVIGVLGLARTEKEPILYFELRFNTKTMNPVIFLRE